MAALTEKEMLARDLAARAVALGSSAAHLALVASGAGLVTVIPKWHLWDVGFGVLMVEESGRRVCDPEGNPIDVIACQPGLPILAGASTALDGLLDSGWAARALRVERRNG